MNIPTPSARSFAPLLFACLLASAPRAAAAAEGAAAPPDTAVAQAEQKAAQAFDAYQSKRFAEAVALYVEAYDAAPNADILYNIARLYETKLGDRPLAISFYRRYIGDPGAVAARIQLASERLVALREAELAASRPAAAPAGPASAPVPARRGWSGTELTGALMATTGVVALGIGIGYGFAAVNETRTTRDLCDGNVCREQRGIDAAERATDHARVATIGVATGSALLALGALFYLLPGGEPEERPLQASAASLRAGLEPQPGGWSLELAGAW